jgi:hypothetical protein
MTNAVDVAA